MSGIVIFLRKFFCIILRLTMQLGLFITAIKVRLLSVVFGLERFPDVLLPSLKAA